MNMLLYEDYSRDQPKVNTGLITKAEDDDDDRSQWYSVNGVVIRTTIGDG